MLVNFKFSNFRSFNSEQILSFETRSGLSKNLSSNYNEFAGKKLLKSLAVFGANASGKSNLIKALRFFREFSLNSFLQAGVIQNISIESFLLNSKNKNLTSTFELEFILEDKIYLYGFSLNREQVITEDLKIVKNKSKNNLASIFSRVKNKLDISDKNQKRNQSIQLLNPKSLFLSLLATTGDELALKIVEKIRNIEFIDNTAPNNLISYTLDNYKNYKKEIDQMISESDVGIKKLIVEDKDVDIDTFINQLPIELHPLLINSQGNMVKSSIIQTVHTGIDETGKKTDFILDLLQESTGTQHLFNISGALFNSIKNGKTLVVDELDAHLHPLLCRYILLQFHINNLFNSQMIFTTHDSSLMDDKFLRRDQILFTEKNNLGESELYSLAELSERDGLDYQKRYLSGRYGALPFISTLENYETYEE